MGMIERIRARRKEGKGFISWLLDRGGWRTLVGTAAQQVSEARERRHGPNDPLARGADVLGDAVERQPGHVGDGDE
jgi:hypothetical protein